MPDVICNTSPVQYLHQVNLLHILHELYGQIAIPGGVLMELDAGRMAGVSLSKGFSMLYRPFSISSRRCNSVLTRRRGRLS